MFYLVPYAKLTNKINEITYNRHITSKVKLAVWKRDQGKCTLCSSTVNLQFDHILPYSKGGTSLSDKNIRILCQKCNLQKSNKIE